MNSKLYKQLQTIINSSVCPNKTRLKFLNRIKQGKLTRDEDPETHFCIYFAGFDPKAKEVFIGLHKKSGLWLFNGGHIDQGETLLKALKREMAEEWGRNARIDRLGKPLLLTLTKIANPVKQICQHHYDIWHFIPVQKKRFKPDKRLLAKEFYQTGWYTIKQARKLVVDPNTLLALDKLEKISTINRFSKKVYSLLKQVPKGKVTTYKALAKALGTKAYRAVGQALKNNPYAPQVPCHRVVSSSGTIGGFRGKTQGKAIKEKKELLSKENIRFVNNRVKDFEKVFFEI